MDESRQLVALVMKNQILTFIAGTWLAIAAIGALVRRRGDAAQDAETAMEALHITRIAGDKVTNR